MGIAGWYRDVCRCGLVPIDQLAGRIRCVGPRQTALVSEGIITQQEVGYVSKVLNAAALTYVAATLQSVLQLAYFVFRFAGSSREE